MNIIENRILLCSQGSVLSLPLFNVDIWFVFYWWVLILQTNIAPPTPPHPTPPPTFVKEGGGSGFLNLAKSRGNWDLRFFKSKGWRKRGKRQREFLKFSLGEKLLDIKLQRENKISEWIEKCFHSYIINYLSSSSFL